LHNITDVEAFCATIVHRTTPGLNEHQHEELLTYLIEECWILSQRFEQRNILFSTYAGTTLRARAAEWRGRINTPRTRWVFKGGVYERPTVKLVPLDDQPGVAVDAGIVDAGAYSDADARRLLRERTSPTPQHDSGMGAAAHDHAA